MEPTPPALESEILTPGPPGKSLTMFNLIFNPQGGITCPQKTELVDDLSIYDLMYFC